MTQHLFSAILVWASMVALSTPSAARLWIVSTDGTGDFTRIVDALDAATSGDSVGVLPGEYNEADGPVAFHMISEKSFALLGLSPDPSEVRTSISLRLVDCPSVLVQAITFHDEYTPLQIHLTPATVRDCIFLDNATGTHSNAGGAILGGSITGLTIERCLFRGNSSSGDGGAISCTSDYLTVRSSSFLDNESAGEGGAVSTGMIASFEECLFVGNRSYNGAAIRVWDDPTIVRCTFYANETTWNQGAAIEMGSRLTAPIRQNIVAGTINGYGVGCWGSAGLECFCFWNNERGNTAGGCADLGIWGNFEANPLFCDPENGDFELNEGSPCLLPEHGGWPCGQIGAFGVGCGVTPTIETTWGRIKAQFWAETKARPSE